MLAFLLDYSPEIQVRGGKETEVVVRFSRYIRPYIERRTWHASETKYEVNDEVFGKGSLELWLTTTGIEGAKHWLKHWIPDMRIILHESLRTELAEALEVQMAHLGKR